MERSQLAIIIPAYNEENTISEVVQKVIPYGDTIVVDDGSSDSTAQKARDAGAIVVSYEVNKGYDGALNSGFEKALELGKNYAITFDADGQHDHALITQFMEKLDHGNELVLGVRPHKARISETVMGLYFNTRFGISDILCGMKGYDLKWVRKNHGFDHVQSIGSELCLFIIKNKAPFCQVPVPIHDRADAPRLGNHIKANLKIFKALIRVALLDFN